MKRDTAYKISRNVETWLKNRGASQESKQVISKSVEQTLAHLQSHIATDFDRIAMEQGKVLAKELQVSLFELANNNWYDHQRQDMIIVPEGTKFVHRHGTKVYLAVEHKPKTRTIKYKPRGAVLETAHRIAFPYCIFVFPIDTFDDARGQTRYKVQDGRMGFLQKPLGSLTDRLCYPSLPNVDCESSGGDLLKMCMGRGFQPNYAASINEQVGDFLSYFWQAPFGTDWEFEFKRIGRADARFKTFQAWQTASEENPLFVLDANNCKFRHAGTLADLITLNVGDDNNLNAPLKKMVKRAVERLSGEIIKTLAKIELPAEFREKYLDKAVYEIMCGVVRDCVGDLEGKLEAEPVADPKSTAKKVEDGLSEILLELEKRVNNPEPAKDYWWTEGS